MSSTERPFTSKRDWFIAKYVQNSKDNYLKTTLERSHSFKHKSRAFFSDFHQTVTLFNKESALKMSEYKSKGEENFSFKCFYSNAKKGPSLFFPQNDMSPFKSLIHQYNKKKVRVPEITLSHNIFKLSPLNETKKENIIQGAVHSQKEAQKAECYLRNLLVEVNMALFNESNLKKASYASRNIEGNALLKESTMLCRDIKMLIELISKCKSPSNDKNKFKHQEALNIGKRNIRAMRRSATESKVSTTNTNQLKTKTYRLRSRETEQTVNLSTLADSKTNNTIHFRHQSSFRDSSLFTNEKKQQSQFNEELFKYANERFKSKDYNTVIGLLTGFLKQPRNYNAEEVAIFLNQAKGNSKEFLMQIRKLKNTSNNKVLYKNIDSLYENNNMEHAMPILSQIKRMDDEIKGFEKRAVWKIASAIAKVD